MRRITKKCERIFTKLSGSILDRLPVKNKAIRFWDQENGSITIKLLIPTTVMLII